MSQTDEGNDSTCSELTSTTHDDTERKVNQLFSRLTQEIVEKHPANVIYFIVDFLCKHYPQHLNGFARIWGGDADLEQDKLQVIEFFRFQKLPKGIAEQFLANGYDTLETLCTLTQDQLPEIEKNCETPWLQGHRVRLLQMFSDICNRVRSFRQEREKLLHMARITRGYCEHPTIVTRTNAPPSYSTITSGGPNPLPQLQVLPGEKNKRHILPPPMVNAPISLPNSIPCFPASMN